MNMNEYFYFPNQVPKGAFTFNSHNEIMLHDVTTANQGLMTFVSLKWIINHTFRPFNKGWHQVLLPA